MSSLFIFNHFFIFILSFYNKIGRNGIIFIYSLNLIASLIISFVRVYNLHFKDSISIIFYENWVFFNGIDINWSLLFDSLSIYRMILINLISLIVYWYAIEYLEFEENFNRFTGYFSLFSAFRLTLVSSGTLIQLFIGWEGVGLASFLLINYWYRRLEANKGAFKALIFNRIGDLGFRLALIFILKIRGNTSIRSLLRLSSLHTVLNDVYFLNILNGNDIIALFIFIAAAGKSAQYGLHSWLLDAREGPTPVSALLHSATRVTAGVFLIIRLGIFRQSSPIILLGVRFRGSLTALIGGRGAFSRFDIKKLTAFSSVSQLGLRLCVCGSGNFRAGFFHLINHAFFKALLFLGCGLFILSYSRHEQDRRVIGNSRVRSILLTIIFSIAVFGLIGFPFSSGFYSKEHVLQSVLSTTGFIETVISVRLFCSIILTTCYSYNLLITLTSSFFTNQISSKNYLTSIFQINFLSLIGPIILCLLTLFGGFLLEEPLLLAVSSENWILSNITFFGTSSEIDFEFYARIILFILLSRFFLIFYFFYNYLLKKNFFYNFIIVILNNLILLKILLVISREFRLNIIYRTITYTYFFIGYKYIIKRGERGFLELRGSFGISYLLNLLFLKNNKLQKGLIWFYMSFLFFFIFLMILVFFLKNFMIFKLIILLLCLDLFSNSFNKPFFFKTFNN